MKESEMGMFDSEMKILGIRVAFNEKQLMDEDTAATAVAVNQDDLDAFRKNGGTLEKFDRAMKAWIEKTSGKRFSLAVSPDCTCSKCRAEKGKKEKMFNIPESELDFLIDKIVDLTTVKVLQTINKEMEINLKTLKAMVSDDISKANN